MLNYRVLIVAIFYIISGVADVDPQSRYALKQQYLEAWRRGSDINEHLPTLYALARECSHVIEIGLREIVSTWGILAGLSENETGVRSYIGIDIVRPPEGRLRLAEQLSLDNEIVFDFWQANDLTIEIEPAEMLFIDTLHTYCHLTYELEAFAPKISKYIAMHDTSGPWGEADETTDLENSANYPAWIDRTKRGLWPAVVDFLARHPEWKLKSRRLNNNGFTVLYRDA